MMPQRGLLTLTMLLLGVSSLAQAQEQLRPEVEIDRSVLQDLKGYEPPPMFGAAAKAAKPVTAPLKRVPVAPPVEATLTVPKADALLDFPVKNTDVVTRQRMTAPEEMVAHARPDYSDSHTVLDTKPKIADATKAKKSDKKKVSSKKAPVPPKKPSVELASVESAPVKKADGPAKKEEAKAPIPANQKDLIKAVKVDPPAAMKAAEAAPKYVPKSRPTMPAVPAGEVEKSKLDAFSLPLEDKDGDVVVEKPTPGERMMDQALTDRLAAIDKADIENTVAGGKVTTAKKEEPLTMAALPSASTTKTKVEQISMEFKPKLTDLQGDQQSILQGDILPMLKKYADSRLQIQAFAGDAGSDSDARRVSLSRALSVRQYLLDKGVDPSRMDVRAMGNNTKEQPADRVDLVFIRQN